jgi:peptidoglycan hydrolase-like protein with peptidoglycan-binding domain
VQTASLLAGLQAQLPGAVVRPPLRDGFLVGEPVPAAPAVSPPPPAIASPTPVPTPVPAPVPSPAPAPPAAAAPAIVLPEEAQMTQNDRMQVQTALQGFGYYAGQSDGIFGPETRAAIRRYQHEIGVEMTGRLTSQQATRLVGKR